jgi:hypothetical protein
VVEGISGKASAGAAESGVVGLPERDTVVLGPRCHVFVLPQLTTLKKSALVRHFSRVKRALTGARESWKEPGEVTLGSSP